MKELKNELNNLLKKGGIDSLTIETLKEEMIYPFSPENKTLSFLLSKKIISFEDYLGMYERYAERNKYLYLYDMAPRTFGETWGENHVLSIFPEFTKATKENTINEYPDFDGEFDLLLDGVRVEVKACRANETGDSSSLANRAYLHEEAIENSFKYHFQQLKPSCCDVFIWIGVCRDELIYWVLTSEELLSTGKLGTQHRNENTGIEGVEVYEGQVFMTEEELEPYKVEERNILQKVEEKGQK